MSHVTSKDGTRIGYERIGSGPPLILVDGALCSRAFGPSRKNAELLAQHFTVYFYDRRGRGVSGDTPPYSSAREVEDVAALIEAAGGSAFVFGASSGAALALHAAASGARIQKLAIYEPPFMVDDPRYGDVDHAANLRALVAADDRGGAVKYFMRMVSVPTPFIFLMQLMRGVWRNLKAVAHTLPYDMAVMGNWQIPARFAALPTPTLALYGGKTQTRLKRAVEELVKLLPNVRQQVLPGQTHNVSAAALVPALVAYFTE
jgi:pimeloyl-ACP methyl ester carboxylesterase